MSLKEHQAKFINIRYDKPGREITRHLNGDWYLDSRGQAVQVRTMAQVESRRKFAVVNRANEERSQKRYVNCYHEPIKDSMHKLKLHELGALIKLLPYLRFGGNGLLETGGKPMSSTAIGKAIGKSGRTSKRILESLVEEGIIIKEGERKATRYYIAERFHTIGRTLQGQAFTKLYQVETRKRTEKLSIQEAGLLYKMLPFFHYETYYLVANPNASRADGEILEHLNQAELARLIGESESVVRDGVKALMAQNILVKHVGCNRSKLLVNPDVMFRAEYESEDTGTIRMQFEEQERGGSFD